MCQMVNEAKGSFFKHWTFRIGFMTVLLLAIGLFLMSHFAPQKLQESWVRLILTLGLVTSGIISVVQKIPKKLLDVITIILAIVAIIFAAWQFSDSREQKAEMQTLAKGMSTRFIGGFPKNLEAINETIAHTGQTLDIIVDVLGYGQYSAPAEGFTTYLRSMEDSRSRNVKLRILVYSRKKAKELLESEFTKKDIEKRLRSHDSALKSFCGRFYGGNFPKSEQEFNRLLLQKQKSYLVDMAGRGAEIKVTDKALAFYLWNADDQEAVVIFPEEVSFRTLDAKLVNTFKTQFASLWKDADKWDCSKCDWGANDGAAIAWRRPLLRRQPNDVHPTIDHPALADLRP